MTIKIQNIDSSYSYFPCSSSDCVTYHWRHRPVGSRTFRLGDGEHGAAAGGGDDRRTQTTRTTHVQTRQAHGGKPGWGETHWEVLNKDLLKPQYHRLERIIAMKRGAKESKLRWHFVVCPWLRDGCVTIKGRITVRRLWCILHSTPSHPTIF